MKKLLSLIKASMTNNMSIIKTKKGNKVLPVIIILYLMFMFWGSSNELFEKVAQYNIQPLILSILIFLISIVTIIEGIYKTSSLIFNSKDDDVLLSLPIEKSTILFIKLFKFYVFELIFNTIFILPIMIAYIRWSNNITWTYYLSSLIMIFLLPIIPIIISTIFGIITSSISSRFKYKNASQIILSMTFLVVILIIYSRINIIINYMINNAYNINNIITRIYYPSGAYLKLITNFKVLDLIVFILINIVIYTISVFILSKFYFSINSRLKNVTSNKTKKINNLNYKSKSIYSSLIKKELNTFFKTPVFIINAGFALFLYLLGSVFISYKFNSAINVITSKDLGLEINKSLILNNLPILILILILVTSFMTSITNSVISLEGKNIDILKSLPIKTKTILMSKIFSSLVLTTPVLLIGDLILLIRFKISIIESILLLIISVVLPLISHLIGLIVNLKYPKLDAENSTEVVKQSTSSFMAVTIGMVLLIINVTILVNIIGKYNSILILIIYTLLYLFFDLLLYLYLINVGAKQFNKLSI